MHLHIHYDDWTVRYRAGQSSIEIARLYNCRPNWVRKILRRSGVAMRSTGRKPGTQLRPEERIEINPETQCHEWVIGSLREGYGWFKAEGRQVLAHRYFFQLHHGYLPRLVRHMCHNRCCCNPEHLKAGTIADNAADDLIKRNPEKARAIMKAGRLGMSADELVTISGLSVGVVKSLITR